MSSTTNPRGLQSTTSAIVPRTEEQRDKRSERIVEYSLWGIAVLVFVVACVIVHFHPAPWPFDLQTTISVQHLKLWVGLSALLTFASLANDPIVSTVELIV